MINYSIWRPMPPELQAQDDELHQLQLDAIDRYDFEGALQLLHQQTELRNKWYQQCVQDEHESSGSSDSGRGLAS